MKKYVMYSYGVGDLVIQNNIGGSFMWVRVGNEIRFPSKHNNSAWFEIGSAPYAALHAVKQFDTIEQIDKYLREVRLLELIGGE